MSRSRIFPGDFKNQSIAVHAQLNTTSFLVVFVICLVG